MHPTMRDICFSSPKKPYEKLHTRKQLRSSVKNPWYLWLHFWSITNNRKSASRNPTMTSSIAFKILKAVWITSSCRLSLTKTTIRNACDQQPKVVGTRLERNRSGWLTFCPKSPQSIKNLFYIYYYHNHFFAISIIVASIESVTT